MQLKFFLNASKILLFLVYSGALFTTFYSNWWPGKYFKCLAGSDCLFGSSCSAHLKTTVLEEIKSKAVKT